MLHHALLAVLILLCPLVSAHAAATSASPFVRPAELEADIAFWRQIYTQVSTSGGLLHDPVDLRVVYEEISFPPRASPQQRSQHIDARKDHYARILRKLASGATDLNAEEQRINGLWPQGVTAAQLREAAGQVRFQLGQADRFREGLVRSGAWRDYIRDTFTKAGLPVALAALPHVESSFDTHAYSRVGAAGMWQFMPATGRRFLRIDAAVDERLDPYRSTQAAARFLEQNHGVLGSWPLALTAYNHGPSGMRRAREQMGTRDITTIVRGYRSRTFGFASRNFYVAFLAAVEIDEQPEKFFGPVQLHPADPSRVLVMTHYVPADSLVEVLDVPMQTLRRLNPSLLSAVWRGSRHVPKGYPLRLPPEVDVKQALARITTDAERYDTQVADVHHRVAQGESLSVIAARHGVSMARLAELNGLRRPFHVRAGQQLALPPREGGVARVAHAGEAQAVSPAAQAAVSDGSSAVEYRVRRGDTLSSIAARHGISEADLMRMNSIHNRNVLQMGQVLALSPAARDVSAEVPDVVPAAVLAAAQLEPPAQDSEPVDEPQAEQDGPALVPGAHTASSADPSDYSVGEGGVILVQAAETLGHYADWLGVRASRLRQLNGMAAGAAVIIGRRVTLDFSAVDQAGFQARRIEYHRQLQEAFFARHRITATAEHVVRPGESVWLLARQRYDIPLWLLRQYNPDLDPQAVRPGLRLIIPVLEPAA